MTTPTVVTAVAIRLLPRVVVSMLVACSAPVTSSPAPVSPTPDVNLGTAIATRTATARPSPTLTKAPQEVLLVLADLPAGFKLIVDQEITLGDLVASSGAAGRADKAAEKQKWQDRGFSGGWWREFTKDALFGAIFIRSSASRYSAIEGAKLEIATNVQSTTQTSGGVQVSLGEASATSPMEFSSTGLPVRHR